MAGMLEMVLYTRQGDKDSGAVRYLSVSHVVSLDAREDAVGLFGLLLVNGWVWVDRDGHGRVLRELGGEHGGD